ncbi:killer cell lectin-like receptor subfamily F member 1 [Gopherus evgoodei]|uniref:killer cell lectin-like receptor subfamily F member 1 n=1 Tax=Gopherus evgoodei TaxID=1825980 RepID=UPI0011CED4D7|nr:killer cell lectin-like receptor subfamily F member 1 [Gopherus evgoodei]
MVCRKVSWSTTEGGSVHIPLHTVETSFHVYRLDGSASRWEEILVSLDGISQPPRIPFPEKISVSSRGFEVQHTSRGVEGSYQVVSMVTGKCVAHIDLAVLEPTPSPPVRGAPPQGEGDLGENEKGARNASLEELVSHLRQRLCESAPGSAADGSGCKVCPRDWLPHKDECYWVSKESKFWSESFKDCEMRTSQMLVIQDREEMEFIQNITQRTNLVWIGLTVKSPEKKWTWVNTSPLDQSLFPVTGSAEGNSCGMIRRNRINSESCNTEFKWVCQMGAILL